MDYWSLVKDHIRPVEDVIAASEDERALVRHGLNEALEPLRLVMEKGVPLEESTLVNMRNDLIRAWATDYLTQRRLNRPQPEKPDHEAILARDLISILSRENPESHVLIFNGRDARTLTHGDIRGRVPPEYGPHPSPFGLSIYVPF